MYNVSTGIGVIFMPIGKQLKSNIAKSNVYEKKQNAFLKGIEEFKDRNLQFEYQRGQAILERSLQRS